MSSLRQPEARSRKPEAILAGLEWKVLRRLDGLLQGEYRTLFRGAGMDLAELREYEYGDDPRLIDWNVTARLDVPYVRRYEEEREISAYFLLDLSPSVDFGSGGRGKLDMLVDFTALVARILTRRGNRVGAFLYDGGAVEYLPPRSGRKQVLFLVEKLLSRGRLERSPPTDLRAFLAAANGAIRRRSLVFLVSDFLCPPGWEEPLAWLRERHELLAVRLLDPLEIALPDLGIITLQDTESGEQLRVDTHDRGFLARFAQAAARREAALRGSLAEAGVDSLELACGDDLAASVLRFARSRSRRASASGAAPPRGRNP
jgi:uncharacterized protein (DUF58 family)